MSIVPTKRPIPLPRGLLPWASHVAISIIYVGKLVFTPKLFPIVSVKCGERERKNVENVRVRIAYIQLTTSVELGGKVL